MSKKFHNCRFFPVSRSRIGVRDDVFSPGQAVIPAQSLSLAKAGAGIHKKGIYFAVDSRLRICRLTKNPSLRSYFWLQMKVFGGK